MTYQRPSLQEIIARVIGDISSRTEGSAYIKKSVERVLAYAVAGTTHGLHGHFDYLADQLFPTTCEIEGLLQWGAMLNLPRKSPTTAAGNIVIVCDDDVIYPVGTVFSGPDGSEYTSTAEATESGGQAIIPIISTGTGTAQNLDVGAEVELVTPIVGSEPTGEVHTGGIVGGTDLELVEDYRGRILDEIRTPTSGGGPGDYVGWATEVSGVTRAWEFGNRMGVGTVSVVFVRDNDVSIIPDSTEIEAVYDHIVTKMPLDVRTLYVVAPVAVPVNITVSIRPNNSDVRAAITSELTELFKNDVELETALDQSNISAAISSAEGEEAHEITAISSLSPGTLGLLTLGTITFNTLA